MTGGRTTTDRLRRTGIGPHDAGFTLVETLITASILIGLVAILVVSSTHIRRSLIASEEIVAAQDNQVRLMDYISRDLRMTIVLPVFDNSQDVITLRMPDFYDDGGTPRDPTISGGQVTYGDPQGVMVRYRRQDNQMVREQETAAGSGVFGTPEVVAIGVQDMDLSFSSTNQVASVSINFAPPYLSRFGRIAEADLAREKTKLTAQILMRNLAKK